MLYKKNLTLFLKKFIFIEKKFHIYNVHTRLN